MRNTFLLFNFLFCLLFFQGQCQDKPILIDNGILINGLGEQARNGWDMLIEDGKISKIVKHIKPPNEQRLLMQGVKPSCPG